MTKSIVLIVLLAVSSVARASLDQTTLALFRAELVEHEGYRTQVYSRGPREPAVIGVGHNLTRAERRAHDYKHHYTHAEIDALLAADIAWTIQAARRAFPSFDREDPSVQTALLHIAFTCGPTGILKWTALRRAVARQEYAVAVREVYRSRWARQVAPRRVEWVTRCLMQPLVVRVDLTSSIPSS